MQKELLAIAGQNRAVGQRLIVDHFCHIASSRAGWNLEATLEFENVDVVEVIIVLSIEAAENDHATAHETGGVSSPSLGQLDGSFHCFYLVFVDV